MEIDAKVASLDGLKDKTVTISELYVEKDGKFFLNVKEIEGYGIDNVGGMRKVLEEAKDGRTDVKKKLEEVNASLETANSKIVELEATQDAKAKDQIEALKEELVIQHQEVIAEKDTAIEGLRGKLKTSNIDNVLLAALGIAEATKNGLKVLPQILGDRYGLDDNDKPIVKNERGYAKQGKDGDMSIAEDVISSVVTDYPEFFKGSGASGSGAAGGSGTPASGSGGTLSRSEMDKDPMAAAAATVDQKTGEPAEGLNLTND